MTSVGRRVVEEGAISIALNSISPPPPLFITPEYHSCTSAALSLLTLYHSNPLTLYYPQVGGIRYAFNSDKPVGRRLLSAASSPSGAPIDPCKMYNVVTTHYLADGGDGYNLIAEAHTLEANGAAQDQVIIGTVKARTPVRGDGG